MTTDNKLFQSILQSGRAQAEIIESEAKENASKIIKDAEARADDEAGALRRTAQQQAERIKNSALSSASLITRNAILSAKRKEINAAVNSIPEYLLKLDDESYFELLYRAAQNVKGEYETVMLSESDLKRAPADFTEKLAAAGVKAALSDTPANIEGGFLLKNGDIETNCSFTAIIEDRRSEIEDFVNLALFEQKGE